MLEKKFPGSSTSLDALCKRYRIDNSKRSLHTALVDCDLLAKVYINLIDQKEPSLDFQNYDIKEKSFDEKNYIIKNSNSFRGGKKRHSFFLKNNLKKIILVKSFVI